MAESALRQPIDALCARLRRHYVFADRVEVMCEALRAPVPAGLDGTAAAAWLTERLQAVSPDRHLSVRWFDRVALDDTPVEAEAARHDAARADGFGVARVELLDAGRIGWVEKLEVCDFNARARHVYEKLGFVVEGLRRDALWWDGAWHGAVSMAILAHEWRTLRAWPRRE